MDEIIKILQQLLSRKPTPKGGIADSTKGADFIGRRLSKKEIGSNAIIGSRLTDASRFNPFSVRNLGVENRYATMREYSDDLTRKFEETVQFIKTNPDLRLTKAQEDNILYNLGVLRRVDAEKNKLEKGLVEQGKNVDEIFNNRVSTLPDEMLSTEGMLEKFFKNIEELQKKIKKTDDVFDDTPSKERVDRINRLYYGKGYTNDNSSTYRGLGSNFLPKLHEAGVIKLDNKIYENLKAGKHHYGGAMTFAPDPVRIWRYHFGDDVFDKMDNWNYNDGETVFEWLKRNNIEPVKTKGPGSATDYMHPVEIMERLKEENKLFNVYKNPKAESSQGYIQIDDPKRQMERIGFHGENIRFLEDSLKNNSPNDFREYMKTKPRPTEPGTVVPLQEGIISVKSGPEAEGMLKDFLQKSDQLSGANVKPIKEGQTTKIDTLPMRLLKNFNTEFRLEDLTNEGYSKEQAEVLIKAKNKITSGEEINPNEALLRVKEEMADDAGVDVDELDFDFQIEEPEPIDEFAKGGIVGLRI